MSVPINFLCKNLSPVSIPSTAGSAGHCILSSELDQRLLLVAVAKEEIRWKFLVGSTLPGALSGHCRAAYVHVTEAQHAPFSEKHMCSMSCCTCLKEDIPARR